MIEAPDQPRTVAYHPAELPDHLKTALENARMDPADEILDALLDPPGAE